MCIRPTGTYSYTKNFVLAAPTYVAILGCTDTGYNKTVGKMYPLYLNGVLAHPR